MRADKKVAQRCTTCFNDDVTARGRCMYGACQGHICSRISLPGGGEREREREGAQGTTRRERRKGRGINL